MSPIPPLLERLRARDRVPDWRRDTADQEAIALAATLEAETLGWPAADRYEAMALLAKATLDAAGTIDALCTLAMDTGERRDWALKQIAGIAQNWSAIEARLAGSPAGALRARARAALTRLAAILPHAREPHLALAPIIRGESGAEAAIDHLEMAAKAGAPITDLYLQNLIAALEQTPTTSILHRALSVAGIIEQSAGQRWLAFQLHRAVAIASIIATRPEIVRPLNAAPDLLNEQADIGAAAQRVLNGAATLPAAPAAQTLAGAAASALFRHSPIPEAETARIALVEAALTQAEAAPTVQIRQSLLGTLNLLAPSTLRFWEVPAWRRAVCERIVTMAGTLPEPPRSWFIGKFSFAAEDYARAAEAFAAAAAADPKAIGPGSYVDHRAVPGMISARTEPALLGAGARCFQVIADRDAPRGPTVIVAANDLYLQRYARTYGLRLAKVAPAGHLHIHAIGPAGIGESEIGALAEVMPGYRVTLSSEPPTIRAPYYFATARLLRLKDWRSDFEGPIIVTDIDSPWSIAPKVFLETRMGSADVGLAMNAQVRTGRHGALAFPANLYPLPAPWVAVPAWAIALAPTAGARRFASLLAELSDAVLRSVMKGPASANWAIDQNILCAAYAHAVRHDPEIAFADLGSPSEAVPNPPWRNQAPPRGAHWIGVRRP